MTPMRTLLMSTFALGLLSTAMPIQAARSFCCTLDSGARSCGDILPEACRNLAYSEFNEKGLKVRSVDAPLTAAQQAARDVELKKQREADRASLDQKRRDTALLATYATEKDLDTARDRAITEIERSIKNAQDKLEAAQKEKGKIAKDAEFYKNKALPAPLKEAMKRNEVAVQAEQSAIEKKKTEIEDVKTRFENDRARLKELRTPRKD